jgi:anhydro-N-acetylmuramic acid kinase
MARYIGLMSGTSLDGVDGVVADLGDYSPPRVLAHRHQPFDDSLRATLLQLNQAGEDELHRAALASNATARCYASMVADLLTATGAKAVEISAIGAHGQTVRHRPREFDTTGYTVQLLNGHLLSELTGIDVVCDFRGRDVAAGGPGAPAKTSACSTWAASAI